MQRFSAAMEFFSFGEAVRRIPGGSSLHLDELGIDQALVSEEVSPESLVEVAHVGDLIPDQRDLSPQGIEDWFRGLSSAGVGDCLGSQFESLREALFS